MFKRTIAALAILAAVLCLAVKVDAAKPTQWLIYWYVCGTDIETERIDFRIGTDLMSDDPNAIILAEPDKNPGDATRCINEVERATLSPNVKIFMQAGGTYVWGHKSFRDLNAKFDTSLALAADNAIYQKGMRFLKWNLKKDYLEDEDGNQIPTLVPVSNGKVGRYVYDKYHRNWHAREQLYVPSDPTNGAGTETDMGSQAGLISFLQAGQQLERELYPEGNVRRVLILVDHGVPASYGLRGICSDEYTGNSLSLKDIQNAFAQVQNGWANLEDKPFEIVAFDACIMSSYETAVAIKDAANYMFASQEVTMGKVMLGYTDLLNDLSANPEMSGAELGKVFCKTTWKDSKITDKEFGMKSNEILTATVVDLSENKMDTLKAAYENFGTEARNFAQQNPDEFVQNFVKLNKAAKGAEKYPSDDYDSPLFVDLRGLAKNAGQNIPELKQAGDELVTAIDNAVIYQKRGESLNRGGGLSIYYPFNLLKSKQGIASYQNYVATDKLAPATQSALYGFLYNNLARHSFDLNNLSDVYVDVDENKKIAWVELDEEQLQKIEGVRSQLIYVRAVNDTVAGFVLGSDNNIVENSKEPGKFESLFRSKWLRINGQLATVVVVSDATRRNKHGKKVDGTELLAIPVKVNGEQRNLFVSCKYPSEKITVIGWAPIPKPGKNGIPKGKLNGFQKGDVVTPLYVEFVFSEKDINDLEAIAQKMYGKTSDELTAEEKAAVILNSNIYGLTDGNPITIGNEPLKVEIGERPLPDGNYAYMFEFINPIGGTNGRADEFAIFKIRGGKVVEVKHSADLEDLKDLS